MLLWRSLCLIQFLILLSVFTWLGLTGDPGKYVPMFYDKLMHAAGYIVAGISMSFAFPHWQTRARAIFLILFSIAIEIGQHFLPPRTYDLVDIVANSLGVIIGLAATTWLEKKLSWFAKLLYLSRDK